MPAMPIISALRPHRERMKLSQAALADRVGISRQAIVAIEAGRQVPSTALSLQLADALGCKVEEMFQLASAPDLRAHLAPWGCGREAPPPRRRVTLARVEGRWVAHPLAASQPTSADAVLSGPASAGSADDCLVRPLGPLADLEQHVLIAGCAPLLGVLSERASRTPGSGRATWLPANSHRALDLLQQGLVHVAGLHLRDPGGGSDNLPWVQGRFGDRPMLLIHLTRWRQGLVLPHGNPNAIREGVDLLRPGLRVARREEGSGARQLLERVLARASEDGPERGASVLGPVVRSHDAVAELVRCGVVDTGIAIESAALAAGLAFVPLSEERFDLAVAADVAAEAPSRRLLDQLSQHAFRLDSSHVPGLDGAEMGSTIRLEPTDGQHG